MESAPGGKRDGITRRDFINGFLIGAGSVLVNGLWLPRPARACDSDPWATNPNGTRGGNVPSVIDMGHWLRFGRVTVGASSVKLTSSNCDSLGGTYPIVADSATYDAIIVGSGIAALSSAFFIRKNKPNAKILILEVNGFPGGVASRDDAAPIPMPSSTGGAYCVAPYANFLFDFYKGVGVNWHDYAVPDPLYCYWFDEKTPYTLPGAKGWNLDTYGRGMSKLPYPKRIVDDILASRTDLQNWYNTDGSPTDPADNTSPEFDYLSQMTFAQYCASKGWDKAVADFYTRYSIDALAGPTDYSNALTSISFMGAEFNPIWAPPGGTSGVARHALKSLIPGAIAGTSSTDIIANPINLGALDQSGNAVKVRLNAIAIQADTGSSNASVVYYQGGQFVRAQGKTAILCGQSHTAHKMVEHLIGAAQLEAFEELTLIPVVVANVTLAHAAPLVDLGLGYDQYWWGSEYWADFVISDWTSASQKRRADRNRPVVLTFYGQNLEAPDKMSVERQKLLGNPFGKYEDSLRQDLNRMLAPAGFDFDRDVTAVYVYRWGHGMIYPHAGYPFGTTIVNGQTDRTQAPRWIARQQVGRISFGAQDTDGSPAIESAIGAGLRTSFEALGLM